MKRVVVTGLGCICGAGNNVPQFLESLIQGRSGIGPLTTLSGQNLSKAIGAEVKNFSPEVHFDESRLALLDRNAQFAVLAAREAVGDAFGRAAMPNRDAAVILGTSIGGKLSDDIAADRLYRGDGRVHPLTIVRVMASAAASHVTIDVGVTGPAFCVTSACASSNHAIGQAARLIRDGTVSWAITGGTDACFAYGLFKAWEAMRILAPDTCRPFSAGRRGLVLGEGAGAVVLESLEQAQARGTTIYAELLGTGASSDAGHITQPSVAGAVLALRRALEDGGVRPEEVDYINAHGTGTPSNDVTETLAIKEVFGGHAQRLAVSSTKSVHGHALGAAGGIELVATVLALFHQFLPPTVNYTGADPQCDLDYVANASRPQAINTALSNSFAFGGLNAVLLLRRWPDRHAAGPV
ncbi:MAG: beta-ketoacyl-[acyl-carrier-protein] synthase family protein [Acidiferrobacterales bacterium]